MTCRPLSVAFASAALALLSVGAAQAGVPLPPPSLGDDASGTRLHDPGEAAVASRSAAAAGADLELDVFGDEVAGTDEDFTLFIEVINWGPDTATGITVEDTIPAGASFVSVHAPAGVTCGHASGVVTCSGLTLTAIDADEDGAFAEIELTLHAPATAGTISNRARVTAQTPADPSPGDTDTTTEIEVRADADVWVYQTAAPVAVNTPVIFRVHLYNDGPKTASNLTITDTLPTGTSFVSATPPAGGSCGAPSGGTLTCTLTTLPAGGEDTTDFEIKVAGLPANGVLTNSVEVSAASPPDPSPLNNSDSEVAVVGNPPLADLYLFAYGSSGVVAGSNATLRFDVYNDGPQTATGTTFTTTLPAGLTFVSGSVDGAPGCSAASGTVTCALGSVASGVDRDVAVVVAVASGATGTLTAPAQVSASSPADPDPDGNRDRTILTVFPPGSTDLNVDAVGPELVTLNTDARFTFSVANAGPSAKASAPLTATLPASVEYMGATTPAGVTCSFDTGTRTVTCETGPLAVDAVKTFDVILRGTSTSEDIELFFTLPTAGDIEPFDNEAEVFAGVVAAGVAAVEISTRTKSADLAARGEPLRWTWGIASRGPGTVASSTFTVTLPASGIEFVSATTPGGNCGAPAGVIVTCSLAPIAPGDGRSVSVVVRPTTSGGATVTGRGVFSSPSSAFGSSSATLVSGTYEDIADAPTASLGGVAGTFDPLTEQVQLIAPFDSTDSLTLNTASFCPAGQPFTAMWGNAGGATQVGAAAGGGRFQVSIPPAQIDAEEDGRLATASVCNGTATWNQVGTIQPFSPTAVVTDALSGAPVAGATATLFHVPGWLPRRGPHQNGLASTCESPASKPFGAAWSQAAPTPQGVAVDGYAGMTFPTWNPEVSTARGEFGWDVVDGCWYAVVSKAGYQPATTPVVGFGSDFLSGLFDPIKVTLQPTLHALTVTAGPGGSVTSVPAGISCPGTCTKTFREGSSVTLTAYSDPGLTMVWSGPCASAPGSICPVTVGGPTTVGVTFAPLAPPPDVNAPRLGLTVPAAARRRAAVLRSGVVASLRASEACAVTLELRLAAATARKLKLPVVIGSLKKTLTAAGTLKVAVKLKPAAKRKLVKLATLRATLVATGKDAAGNTGKTSLAIVIRR